MNETDQVRAQSAAKMGSPLGELYSDLYQQVASLRKKWRDFRALFDRDRETIDLLNATAPTFFYDLQRMMWEDLLLHLCRLTDPPKTRKYNNLTLARLPISIPSPGDLLDQVEKLVKDATQKTQFARDWRNRRLAHRELPTPSAAPPAARASRMR
jgi:enoyl reductase-like protein